MIFRLRYSFGMCLQHIPNLILSSFFHQLLAKHPANALNQALLHLTVRENIRGQRGVWLLRKQWKKRDERRFPAEPQQLGGNSKFTFGCRSVWLREMWRFGWMGIRWREQKMLKESLGKIRIRAVLQAQLERIPEVRNHQISRRMYSVPDFTQAFFVTSSSRP